MKNKRDGTVWGAIFLVVMSAAINLGLMNHLFRSGEGFSSLKAESAMARCDAQFRGYFGIPQ